MQIFETILVLLLSAALVSSLAKRLDLPYPTILAIGGALVALLPSAPRLELAPDLILALFVAPVLMDAAFRTSLRDLWDNRDHVMALVLLAVALTTAVVAVVVRHFLPGMPWSVAVTLGALLAPPDAVAATAVLRKLPLPLRIRMVLEGESLLNDASALLIYKVAVAAAVLGSFSFGHAMPMFALVVLGGAAAGVVLAWPASWFMSRFQDVPSAVIFQFGLTFGIWLVSERLGLSPIVTVVTFAITFARKNSYSSPAYVRIASFAIWDSATVILNALAFTLVGLQLRPILETLSPEERIRSITVAAVILAVVVVVRLVLVLIHYAFARLKRRGDNETSYVPSLGGALLVGWSGMRGMVTLAAAMALPADFPYRDFIQLTAFVVVLGTLAIQGLTLSPLLKLVRLPPDYTIRKELALARETALRTALADLNDQNSPAAERLKLELTEALSGALPGLSPGNSQGNKLRRHLVGVARHAIENLRRIGAIGDDAYRQVEAELDWVELSSGAPSAVGDSDA
ncbi:cation:proton antiporter [Dyella sp. Tek66A03]|uniref:cation:proton antiporter n=1 Tax=Dyella sp. Tek66A03 TaxID=3458298 RepID=UPI00403E88E4